MSQPGRSSVSDSERQEMRQIKAELQQRGLVEDSMSLKEMKELLETMVISEQSANNSMEQNIPESKTPEPSSPIHSQSYADKLTQDNERKSKSPELSLDQSNKSLSQEKQPDSGDEYIFTVQNSFGKDTKENQRTNKNKGRRSGIFDKSSEGKNDNKRTNQKPNARTRQAEKMPELKLTQQDFDNNKEDESLISRYRLSNNKTGQDGNSIEPSGNNSVIFDRLRKHLLQTAEICHIQRTNSVALNFQWGTAIKVGETNGSFERKIVSDEETPEFNDNTNQPETSTSYSLTEETTRRRKRCTNITAVYEYGDVDSEEEQKDNSDEDFQLGPKRQKTARASNQKKATSSKVGSRKKFEPTTTNKPVESLFIERKSEDRTVCVDVSDECAITDDETTDEPPKKVQRSKSKESETFYPRRIVPPRLGSRWAGIRARKPLNEYSNQLKFKKLVENDRKEESITSQRSKSNPSLQDNEVARVLEENDEADESDCVTPLKGDDTDVKPLRTSTRMKMQSQRLVKIQEEEKQKEMIRLEQERIKEETIHREKMRCVQQRIREENDKQMKQDAEEKRQAERDENWRNLIAQGNKKRFVERAELYPDGRPQSKETLNHSQENSSNMDQSEDEFVTDTGNARKNDSNRVLCPICNRRFEVDEIEAHAGACEEFDSCPPGFSRSSSPSLTPPKIPRTSRPSKSSTLECEVCKNFTTENGKEFESHSYECLRRTKYGQPFTPDTVIEVPTSPLRTVRTISQLIDSEINYKSQFEPKTKSTKTVTKRKRRL